jgi:hypothetical protein
LGIKPVQLHLWILPSSTRLRCHDDSGRF